MMASAAQALHPRFDARGLDETARPVYDSLKKVERWVEDHDYQAYEPFDGLSSPLAGLTGDHLLMGQLLQQIGRQSPINFRPILGVKPLPSTKGRGYMAAGYLTLYRLTGDDDYRSKAVRCLEWLMAHKSPKFAEYSWGNHFDYAGRGGRYSRDESIIVWTSLIGQAFLDGFELLGERRFLDVAESVCRWIMALPKLRTDSGSCLSYYMIRPAFVHNASMLGAAMLARTWRHSKHPAFLELASSAMEYSCTRQCADGSWFYGEEPKYHWVDNFHTGYNLDSLKCYVDNTGDARWAPQLARGFEYFKTTFFEESGRPKYLPQPRAADRHPVRLSGGRNARQVRGFRQRRPAARAQGGGLDDCKHAGPDGLLLLPEVPADHGENSHAALGTSDDVPRAGAAPGAM